MTFAPRCATNPRHQTSHSTLHNRDVTLEMQLIANSTKVSEKWRCPKWPLNVQITSPESSLWTESREKGLINAVITQGQHWRETGWGQSIWISKRLNTERGDRAFAAGRCVNTAETELFWAQTEVGEKKVEAEDNWCEILAASMDTSCRSIQMDFLFNANTDH